jgi:hypothetical protein
MRATKRGRPDPDNEPTGIPKHATVVPLGVEGALAGAAVGSIAGPVGVIAGTALGGLFGAMADEVLEQDRRQVDAHDEELDEEIGVMGGDIGAAAANQPTARFGAYSSSSSGASDAGTSTSEGPIQEVDE